MEWEPIFVLAVTGGTLLVSTLRNVIDSGRRASPAPSRRAAPVDRERVREIGDLRSRVATLEWIAGSAAQAAAERTGLRRGAA